MGVDYDIDIGACSHAGPDGDTQIQYTWCQENPRRRGPGGTRGPGPQTRVQPVPRFAFLDIHSFIVMISES